MSIETAELRHMQVVLDDISWRFCTDEITYVKGQLRTVLREYECIGDRDRADGVRLAIDQLQDVIEGTV